MKFSRFYYRGIFAFRARARMNGRQRTALHASYTPVAIYARSVKHK